MRVESRCRSVRTKAVFISLLALGAVAASTGVGGKTVEHPPLSTSAPLVEMLHDRLGERHEIPQATGSLEVQQRQSFALGRDFSLAVFNASRLKKDQYATKHLIVDLVYLMDRLEGQREADSLREVLRKVVKDTSTAEQLSAELNGDARRYRSRLKTVDRWYFDVGFTALHLAFASYHNLEASVRTDLVTLRELRVAAPEDLSVDASHRMTALERFAGSAEFEDEDFQRLFYAAWGLLEVLGG